MKNNDIITVVAIVGAGGSGKDSLLKEILRYNIFNFNKLTATTTRKKRKNEHEGVEYYFKDEIDNDEFLIYSQFEISDGSIVKYGYEKSIFKKEEMNIGIFDNVQLKKLKELDSQNKINLISVFLEVPPDIRLTRMIRRLGSTPTREEINEVCRRTIDDNKSYFSTDCDYTLDNVGNINVTTENFYKLITEQIL